MTGSSLQSGLGTVQRTWSSLSTSQDIEWPSSPERGPSPPPPPKVLTAKDRRMQAIMSGLEERIEEGQDSLTNGLAESSAPAAPILLGQKRPSPAPSSSEPAKKKRVLPSSWKEDVPPSGGARLTLMSGRNSRGNVQISGGQVLGNRATAPAPVLNASSKAKAPAGVFLSAEQAKILRLVQNKENVFYTGSAGTGKSVLLREIIKTMKHQYAKSADAVAVTASTGIAACNIGGITIHSFAGIGIGADPKEKLLERLRKNKKSTTRWARTKVLIIDEVSMVDGDLFDKLEFIGRSIRKISQPFGGIQIIVTGDFFQLPPVSKGGNPTFAFEAQTWNSSIKHTYKLTKVFRQKDQDFVDMLNEMRYGALTERSIRRFKELSRPRQYDDGLQATELFPRREDVDRSNETRIHAIQTSEEDRQHYNAQDGGILEPEQRRNILANFMAPPILQLKIGAQVMLIKNKEELLVNGSMGRVLAFKYKSEWEEEMRTGGVSAANGGAAAAPKKNPAGMRLPVVEFQVPNGTQIILVEPETFKTELPNGDVQASRTQLPLILAWAMSIHKSQGQTLDRVKVDLGRVFEKGQAYVALSRATSLDGLQVLNFNPAKVQAHPKVIEWSRTLTEITS